MQDSGRGSAALSGTVRDTFDRPVPGATIALRAEATGLVRFGTTSDADGAWQLTDIPAGTYVLEVRHVGYRSVQETLTVRGGERLERAVRLEQRALPGDEVVVSGRRADEALAPITITNISAEELTRMPDMKDLPVHLSRQPSITYHSENGNAVGYSTLRLRGFGQRRLAVSINGIPQNDPEESNVFWINFFDIQGATQDIQIQRGATSARFGPAGIGGAISIRAMPYKPTFEANVHVGAGSFGTRRASVDVNSGLLDGRFVVFGRLSRLESDGYRDWSWTEFWRFFAGVTWYGQDQTVTVQAYGGPQRDGLAFSGIPREANDGPVPDGFGGTIDRRYNFSALTRDVEQFHQPHLEVHHTWAPGGTWSMEQSVFGVAGYGYFDFGGTFRSADYLRLPGGIVGPSERAVPLFLSRPDAEVLFRAYLDQWQVGWLPSVSRHTDRRTTTLGVEARLHRSLRWGRIQEANDVIPSSLVGSGNDVRVYSFRGEKAILSTFLTHVERLAPQWSVQADVQATWRQYRVYDEAFFGTSFREPFLFLNPAVGVHYRAGERFSAFTSVALANREPRMKSLYDGEEAGAGFQRQYVRPEQVIDLEVGGAWRSTLHRASVTLFHMRFIDEIVPSGGLDQFGVPRTGNADRTRHAGLEIDGGIRLAPGLDASGNVTFSRNRLVRFTEFLADGSPAVRDGNPIAGFPDASANLMLTWTRGPATLTGMLSHVGEQYIDNGGDSGVAPLPAYTIVDITASYTWKALRLSADVNNALDHRVLSWGNVGAVGPQYFPLATRHVLFSARYTLR
jgi:iron complex outermembrane receptor protein